ncbi:acid phosphatase [Pseudomonas cavernicola]|uniref:5'-nucleotidase n=1 Tax=Pseudomonas cavernicola TaxID=2320866 RepID=A0A418XLR4_9PSED|nr:5'/3'-nucleotidase SurE [Pseudomonas cavernicola]RJG10753.1 acid phosphatase [Pseudomonas cavernicola]RJG10754.1 acid phosphatase [Pseudomonas cavernicola]RJG13412.1 acid phosphatase [Pseudomonas cavernicola]
MNKLLTAALGVAGVSLSLQANALNILLTNDDGCRAPGIGFVYQALVGAGHQVTLVGPLNDSSGIGAASVVNPGQAVAVTELAPGKFCVGPPEGYTPPAGKTSAIGTPVDAVNVGLGLLLKDNPPDLVVSGTNFGDNVGPLTQMSGTVNAAVRAMFKGVPAVAVSTAIDMELFMRDRQAGYLKTLNAMDDTANFAVKVIDKASATGAQAKRQCEQSKDKAKPFCELNVLGLPGTTGLNINYPAREASEVTGVSYAPIGDWGTVNFVPQRGADGIVRVNLVSPPTPTAAQQQADAYQLWSGNAVITVIDGNMTALPALQEKAKLMLEGLKP